MTVVSNSIQVRDALARERKQVVARLQELQAQARRLHALVEQIDRDVDAATLLIRQMDEILGIAPQLALEVDDPLRGYELQRVAIDLLRRNPDAAAGAPVHYRNWYELLLQAGGRVAGKDPLATFLTQISRANEVESVRPRSGLYRLRTA